MRILITQSAVLGIGVLDNSIAHCNELKESMKARIFEKAITLTINFSNINGNIVTNYELENLIRDILKFEYRIAVSTRERRWR